MSQEPLVVLVDSMDLPDVGMDGPKVGIDEALSVAAGVSAVAGSYAVVGRTPSFVVSPVESWLSRLMPGEVIAFAITTLGDLGQELNLLAATLLVVTMVSVLARGVIYVTAKTDTRSLAPLGTAIATGLLGVLLVEDPGLAATAAIPAGVAISLGRRANDWPALEESFSTRRRRVLAAVGSTLGIGALGYAVGTDRGPGDAEGELPPVEGPNVDRAAIRTGLDEAKTRALPYADLDPLVSTDFYQVSKQAIDPNVDREDWSLSITGAVEQELEFDYQDVLEMPAENRFVTLRCVGENLNGKKMDNALWTGVPASHLIEQAGPTSDCECVMLHGADGYYVQFPLAALEPGLLAYGMNGTVLPRGNGYPLRALVPGHWGEVNTKWLTEIEFLNEAVDGYWEKRGWHGTGPVVPVAKIETLEDRDDGTRLLGGRAYAGTRGVGRVEVSTDGGETWAEAELSDRLTFEGEAIGAASEAAYDAWRQWAYTYEPPSGSHTVVARMIDENGQIQPSEERNQYPNGPSGWVSLDVSGL